MTVDKNERAFVGMDNPRHDHYRRMFTKEFGTKRMFALRPKIEAIAERLIDELAAHGGARRISSPRSRCRCRRS